MRRSKYIGLLLSFFFFSFLLQAQVSTVKPDRACIGCKTGEPAPSAALDIISNNRGVLIPRLDSTAVISSPTLGLLIFDKSTNAFQYYNGTTWIQIGADLESVTLGINNAMEDTESVAVGKNNTVTQDASSVIGIANQANASNNSAFGYGNITNGPANSAFGFGNETSLFESSAFGFGNKSSNNQSVAFGHSNEALGAKSIAMGGDNQAMANNANAIGQNNMVSANNGLAVGRQNQVNRQYGQVFGQFNVISADSSSAIGYSNQVTGANSHVYGKNNTTDGRDNTIFGEENIITSRDGIAIGKSNQIDSIYNLAFGQFNTVTSDTSMAIGHRNVASGFSSVAVGNDNRSSGLNAPSSAFGYSNEANANNSSAFGLLNEATGAGQSNAFGYSNEASGFNSSAFGHNNNANGNSSSAFGVSNDATATSSSAFGLSNQTTGASGSAFGYNNNSFNTDGSAFGSSNRANGVKSSAFGHNNRAQETESSAFGLSNQATAVNSSAFGHENQATAINSSAFGYQNEVTGGNSNAFGHQNNVNGSSSNAYGYGLISDVYGLTTIGMYNQDLIGDAFSWIATDPVFSIGNGQNSSSRSNALTILKNGKTGIGTTSPDVLLDVAGDGRFSKFGTLSAPQLTLNQEAGDFARMRFTNSQSFLNGNNDFFAIQANIGVLYISHQDNGLIDNILTIESSNNSVGINDNTPDFMLDVNGTAGKPGGGDWSNASDKRLKKDVEKFEDGLKQILKIRPVWYRYNGSYGLPTKEKYVGIIAQEMQKVAPYTITPYLATDEKTGNQKEFLSYNGTAVTYMLVNAIQEQQEMMENQQKMIEAKDNLVEDLQKQNQALEARLSKLESIILDKINPQNNTTNTLSSAKLEQNNPNPFKGKTSIQYYIPEGTNTASLRIADANGRIIKEIPIITTGEGQIELATSTLGVGNYFYSLLLDGQLFETKQMILQQ